MTYIIIALMCTAVIIGVRVCFESKEQKEWRECVEHERRVTERMRRKVR